jgi:hypothetical protein
MSTHDLNGIICAEFDPLMKSSPDRDDWGAFVNSCVLDRFYFWRLDRKLNDLWP